MEVYKFGGASVATADNIKNVISIIKKEAPKNLIIVVSAMGKTTNYLEKVWQAHLKDENWLEQLLALQQDQFNLIDELFYANTYDIKDGIRKLFDGLIYFLNNNTINDESYIYDQLIVLGELTSSFILSRKLEESEVPNHFHYAKQLIRTDQSYREGKVDWKHTKQVVQATFTNGTYVTQGFVGGTSNNQNTTLGREGSDYSAAIFAYCLGAEKVTIWKDVEGVLNADPQLLNETVKIENLDYNQAVELTYYGAKVIHPKTIEPLKLANIPLCVRSYENTNNKGTIISNIKGELPPIFIQNKKQILLKFEAKGRFLNPKDMCDVLYLCKEAQLPIFFTDYSPTSIKISTNNQDFKLDLVKYNLPEDLKLVNEQFLDMAVYYGSLENTPSLKNVEYFKDNGTYRIALGNF